MSSPRHRTGRRSPRLAVARRFTVVSLVLGAVGPIKGAQPQRPAHALRIDSLPALALEHVDASVVTYRGRRAIRIVERTDVRMPPFADAGEAMAVVLASDFHDGTIDVDVAGAPKAGAAEGARGFIGVAFRVQPGGAKCEAFYLRPTNGRADDQLRRNHSTQYISPPDYPWERLRKENPGVYESYVDLEPGVWTHMRIVVRGVKAQLFVNGAPQPVLIVNDLKLGADAAGKIALWIGLDTEGYFANLTTR